MMNDKDLVEMVNNLSILGQCDISTFVDYLIGICHQNYFNGVQGMIILNNVKNLKSFIEHSECKYHPSLSKILRDVGNAITETSASHLALPFFMEQLMVEKYYLGSFHPDLASVLCSIGQIYEKYDKMFEAKDYLHRH